MISCMKKKNCTMSESPASPLFKHILAEKMKVFWGICEYYDVCLLSWLFICCCWIFFKLFSKISVKCLATKANIQRSNVCLSIKVCSSAGSDMLLKPLESVKSALRGLGGDWFLNVLIHLFRQWFKVSKVNPLWFLGLCSNYSQCFAILLPKSLSPRCKHMVIVTLVVLAFGAFFPLIPLFGM